MQPNKPGSECRWRIAEKGIRYPGYTGLLITGWQCYVRHHPDPIKFHMVYLREPNVPPTGRVDATDLFRVTRGQ